MKLVLSLLLVLVVSAGPAFGQAGVIALYADPGGADCSITDPVPGVINVYVVHTGTSGATGSQWAAPLPACMTNAVWISDTQVMPATIGDSQNGIAMSYGGCLAGPVHILTISIFGLGLSGTCCEYWVVPDPSVPSGEIEVVDCGFNTLYAQSALATVNGDGSCPCGGAIESSFGVPQSVLGGGGGSLSSANYGTRATVGQPATGSLSSASYGSNIGYWYLPRTTTTGVNSEPVVPEIYSLDQNYPNPFNPQTTIRFTLPQRSHVTLRVYDVRGKLVMTLLDRAMAEGVHHEVLRADGFSSGVYFYRIKAGGFENVRKMVVLK